jgi:hypothetical protein
MLPLCYADSLTKLLFRRDRVDWDKFLRKLFAQLVLNKWISQLATIKKV